MLINKSFIESMIKRRYPLHLDSQYCQSMRNSNKCMKGCESANGCEIYFEFVSRIKLRKYKTTETKIDETAYEDFLTFFYEYTKKKIVIGRKENIGRLIYGRINRGDKFEIDENLANNFFSIKFDLYPMERIFAEVLGTDEEKLGNIWIDGNQNAYNLEYLDRIMDVKSRLPILGMVYFCKIVALDERNKARELGDALVHSDELLKETKIKKRID